MLTTLTLASVVVLATGLAAALGQHRDRPWLPAAMVALLYTRLVALGHHPAQLAPVLGGALLAGLALTRLDGGRPRLAMACGLVCLLNLGELGGSALHGGRVPEGMPVLPVLLALWTALRVADWRHRTLYAGLVAAAIWATVAHSSPLMIVYGPTGQTDWLPLLTVGAFVLARWLYPIARAGGPVLSGLFLGALLLTTAAGSGAVLRLGAPVAGWLGCCFAALLPAVLDESRTQPDRSFGLDAYYAEALALAGALGLGWLHGF